MQLPGGQARTLWNGLLTDAEAASLVAEVGAQASIREVEFEEVQMPEPQEPAEAPASCDLDD